MKSRIIFHNDNDEFAKLNQVIILSDNKLSPLVRYAICTSWGLSCVVSLKQLMSIWKGERQIFQILQLPCASFEVAVLTFKAHRPSSVGQIFASFLGNGANSDAWVSSVFWESRCCWMTILRKANWDLGILWAHVNSAMSFNCSVDYHISACGSCTLCPEVSRSSNSVLREGLGVLGQTLHGLEKIYLFLSLNCSMPLFKYTFKCTFFTKYLRYSAMS